MRISISRGDRDDRIQIQRPVSATVSRWDLVFCAIPSLRKLFGWAADTNHEHGGVNSPTDVENVHHSDGAKPRASTLWLPLENRNGAWMAVLALLFLYLATMSRDMSLFDSPELALVAYQLGLGHPPGQPLHTLLGFVFAHLPLIPPLLGLNALSAICGALTVIPAISIAEAMFAGHIRTENRISGAVLCTTVVFCGIHAALWEPATRIEVYSLANLFGLWSIAALAHAPQQPSRQNALLLRAGIALGLCASTNGVIALMIALAATPRMIYLLKSKRISTRGFAWVCVGGLAGLLPYAYVPLAAYNQDAFVWGRPLDLDSLRFYFSGQDYARSRPNSLIAMVASSRSEYAQNRIDLFIEWGTHIAEWLSWSIRTAVIPLLLLGIAGCLGLARHALGYFLVPLLLTLELLFITSNTIWRPDNPDYLGYLGASLWLASAGVSAVAAKTVSDLNRWYKPLLLLVLVGLLPLAPPAIYARTRYADHVTRTIAQGALKAAPPKAILVVEQDGWVAPLLYLKYVEALRPDVVIMAVGLASSSWYWKHIYRHNPDLKRFPLVGPKGRFGRIRRFLGSNSDRPAQFETVELAMRFNNRICLGTWLLNSGQSCNAISKPNKDLTSVLENALERLGAGSPTTDSMIAALCYQRGMAYLRLGFAVEAVDAFLAGVPKKLRPARDLRNRPKLQSVKHAPRLLQPVWNRPVLLGDPGRNLFMAGMLFLFANDTEAARKYIVAAANTGLPEAISATRKP